MYIFTWNVPILYERWLILSGSQLERRKNDNTKVWWNSELFEEFYGGNGKEFNLNLLPKESNNLFLAGGVTCENVENMIKTASPYCIDVSSGVETDGVKDEEKIKKIIDIVRKQ